MKKRFIMKAVMKRFGKQAICLALAAILIMAGAKRTSAASKVLTGYYTDGYWSVNVQKKGNKAKVNVSYFSESGCAAYKTITRTVKNNKMLYYAKSADADVGDAKIKISLQFRGKKIKCTVLPLEKDGPEKKYSFTVKRKSKKPGF